jgi:hypothetical protein
VPDLNTILRQKLYSALVLAQSPVGYWRLGDASGSATCADATGNGYTGTAYGGLGTVTLNAGGAGYAPGANVLTVVQAGAVGGIVTATADAGGAMVSIDSVSVVGTAYAIESALAVTGGLGAGCKVNITALSGVVLGATGTIADGDTAAVFDGTTGLVSMGHVAAFEFGATPFSVEAWFKKTTVTRKTVVGQTSITTGEGWVLRVGDNSSGLVQFLALDLNGANTIINVKGNVAYIDGLWHYVVATWDGTTAANGIKIYVDGAIPNSTFQGTAAAGSIGPAAARSALTGAMDGVAPGEYFNGTIDEVAVYPSCLSAGQVAAHYALRTVATDADLETRLKQAMNVLTGEQNARLKLLILKAGGSN